MCIAFFLVASVSCESASHGTESTPKRIPELLSLSNQNDTATTPAGAPGPESARTTDARVPTGRAATDSGLESETTLGTSLQDQVNTGLVVRDSAETARTTSDIKIGNHQQQEKTTKKKKKKKKKKATTRASKTVKPIGKEPKTLAREKSSLEGTDQQSGCVRRLKSEWREAVKMGIAFDWVKGKDVRRGQPQQTGSELSATDYIRIGPLGNNLLRWHFTVKGLGGSDYDRGLYHGRLVLPRDYPLSPPRVQMLTPSGRFVPGEDICLSASSYHPESWTPRWRVRSLVDALRLHMATEVSEIGGVRATPKKRRKLAEESRAWEYQVKRGCVVSHSRMVAIGCFGSLDPNDNDPNHNTKTDSTDGGLTDGIEPMDGITVTRAPVGIGEAFLQKLIGVVMNQPLYFLGFCALVAWMVVLSSSLPSTTY